MFELVDTRMCSCTVVGSGYANWILWDIGFELYENSSIPLLEKNDFNLSWFFKVFLG